MLKTFEHTFQAIFSKYVTSIVYENEILSVVLDNNHVITNENGRVEGNIEKMSGVLGISTYVYKNGDYFSYEVKVFACDDNVVSLEVSVGLRKVLSFHLNNYTLEKSLNCAMEYDNSWKLIRIGSGLSIDTIDQKDINYYFIQFLTYL
jgi:hypothetical protein